MKNFIILLKKILKTKSHSNIHENDINSKKVESSSGYE